MRPPVTAFRGFRSLIWAPLRFFESRVFIVGVVRPPFRLFPWPAPDSTPWSGLLPRRYFCLCSSPRPP